MKNKPTEVLTDEKLIKRRDLLKGVLIGFGVVFILGIASLTYIFASKGFKNINMATLIPVFSLPITFIPLLINLNLLNKAIKARNL